MTAIRRQDGFTMVELMITMAIFLLAITAASQMFVGLLTQFKQQGKIAETNIEGAVSLELLRFDIEQAGFGLPWNLNGLNYVEAVNDGNTTWNDTLYNDNNNPPRAFAVGTGAGLNGSDVLVIKATNVATNTTAPKWTYFSNTGAASALKKWRVPDDPQEDLLTTDHVIVMAPFSLGERLLISSGGNYTRPGAVNSSSTLTLTDVMADANYQPLTGSFESTLIYGITPAGTNMSMPFNRADYYIRRPANIPLRCEPNTGVLYKATLNHADGLHTELPLVDCVLDMQVVVYYDTAVPPVVAPPVRQAGAQLALTPIAAATSATAAEDIRNRVKEVRVYIVAQEGQMDPSYTYTNTATAAGCTVTDLCINDIDYNGVSVLVKAVPVPNRNYRWKLYTLVITPYNLK